MSPFAEYRITSPYGSRKSPITGKQEWHTGIDLVKEHKGPIYAFTAGEVIHAKEGVTGSGFGGYGIVVAVRDPNTGHLHVYAHLDAAVVKVGQQVQRGQMIGRQGNTGQSTGSHLHYEIRKTSSPSYGWIADRQNNCFEPTQYLVDYYEQLRREQEAKAQPPVSDWAKDAHTWVVQQGISDGSRPKDPVTREEVWTMLHRALRK